MGLFGDHRAHLDTLAIAGSDLELLNFGGQLLDERVGGIVANGNGHRNGHATLSGRTVARTDQGISGLVHIGIGHHHHVVLGAAERLHALTVRGSGCE